MKPLCAIMLIAILPIVLLSAMILACFIVVDLSFARLSPKKCRT